MLQLSNRETVNYFISFFRKNGINDNGIAGLLGNCYAESGVRTNNLQNSCETKFGMTDVEFTKAVDNGSFNFCDASVKFGYGLCQWTSIGRRTGLYNHCKTKGVSIADETAQFEWLLTELKTSYTNVYNELISNSNSIESCAEIVVCKFEVPASVITGGEAKQNTINKRVGYAKEFYEEFLKGEEMAKNLVVAINAGHWLGNPKGVPKEMRVLGGTLEWTLNKRVVDKFVELMAAYDGVTIVQNYDVTGQSKVNNELSDRIRMAEQAKADIYLSIHHNGANVTPGTWSGGGTTVYYYKGNTTNQRQATAIYNEIKARTGLQGNRSTPVSANNTFTEIVVPTMNSYIIEAAFMNSNIDIEYINKPEWATQIAEGLIAFLVKEYGLVRKTVIKDENPIIKVDDAVNIKIMAGEFSQTVTLNKGDSITITKI